MINLRLATETAADIDAEPQRRKAAGINFVHLPFDPAAPDPMLVDNFLKEFTSQQNQPAFVHCASGNRAAALWMIKRVVVTRGTSIVPRGGHGARHDQRGHEDIRQQLPAGPQALTR